MDPDTYINDIIDAIIRLEGDRVTSLAVKAIDGGVPPFVIINQALTAGLRKVGDLFADEQMFLPELVQAGYMVTKTMEKIKPYLSGGEGSKRKALCMVATVEGDVHDIGKNLVNLLLSASGYEVIDLGKSVPTKAIVEQVNLIGPDILGLSALLSTTMPAQQKVIQVLEETGIREKVKIMVGGAPVTRSWADKIGADGFAEDAASAVKEADRILGLG
jgi:corrinoid protein of di/trimethylamine methyltransferase